MTEKIAIIGDLHFGVKKSDKANLDHQLTYIIDRFLPELSEQGIKHVIQTGDFFDNRTGLSHHVIHAMHDRFIPAITKHKMNWWILVGNHDIPYKDSLDEDGITGIFRNVPGVTIVNSPKKLKPWDIDLIPWICNSNRMEIAQFIDKSSSKFCVGHFELTGYEYMPSIVSQHGDNPNMLRKYERVISGHFHSPSKKKNIIYVGTPYKLSFSEANDEKQYLIFDGKTFEQVLTNDDWYSDVEYSPDIDMEKYRGKNVRILADSEDDTEKLLEQSQSLTTKIKFKQKIEEKEDPEIELDKQGDFMSMVIAYLDGTDNDETQKIRVTEKLKDFVTEYRKVDL